MDTALRPSAPLRSSDGAGVSGAERIVARGDLALAAASSVETGFIEKTARNLAAQLRMPRVVKLELILTERCNLACTYCFELAKDNGRVMSFETAAQGVDLLIEASRGSPWVGISLMGGEPMEQFDLIQRIVPHARSRAAAAGKDVSFDMTTNGTLLRETHMRYLRDAGVRYCLSLDGLAEDHDLHRKTLGGKGTFEQIVSRLREMKRYQHWQGTRMTITPQAAGRVARNIEGLHELGINQFILGFATHMHWNVEALAELARSLRGACDFYIEQRVLQRSRRLRIGFFEKGELGAALRTDDRRTRETGWGCGAGSGRLAVTPKGVLHGCSKLAWGEGGSDAAPLPLGTIATGLDRPDNRALLLDHSIHPRGKCQDCELNTSCQGGCHAANHHATGNIYEPPDDFCQLMFTLKDACEYVRARMDELGLRTLEYGAPLPDLERMQGELEEAGASLGT